MEVYILPKIADADKPTPRMVISNEGYLCTEIFDQSQPDVMVYHFCNPKSGLSAVMTASKEGIVIIEENPFKPTSNPAISFFLPSDNKLVISEGAFDKDAGAVSITSVSQLDYGISAKAPRGRKGNNDGFDDVREMIVKEIIQPISKAVGDADNALTLNTKSVYATTVLKIWSYWALPTAQSLLYSNSEEEFEEYRNELMFENALVNMVMVPTIMSGAETMVDIYRATLSALKGKKELDVNDYEGVSSPFAWQLARDLDYYGRQAQTWTFEIINESGKYQPSIELISVNGQSATVKGSFSNFDGRYTETGYILYKKRNQVADVRSNFHTDPTYTFTNLEKGADYTAVAYVNVMGATYYSSPVAFHIDGELELSQYSVQYELDGGTTQINVTLPNDKWTWRATCPDGWCRLTTLDATMFQINVDDLVTTSRSTTVTVTATSPQGDIQQKTISVIQGGENYVIHFEGNRHIIEKRWSSDGYSVIDEMDWSNMFTLWKNGDNYYMGIIFSEARYEPDFLSVNIFTDNVEQYKTTPWPYTYLTSYNCQMENGIISMSGNTCEDERQWQDMLPESRTRFKGSFNVTINLQTLTAEIEEHGEQNYRFDLKENWTCTTESKSILSGEKTVQ